MKNNVLISMFVVIILACVVISGVESIQLILKSILYMVAMSVLMFVGVIYVVNQTEEETS